MEERKADPRIYIVSTIFLAFILSGGILLGLYIFQPAHQIKHWYPTLGLTLVAIPWAFWFFTYIYRCIRPPPQHPRPYSAEPQPAADAAPTSSPHHHSPVECSSHGPPHVQFGAVVVIHEDDNNNNVEKQDNNDAGVTQRSCVEQDQSSNGTKSNENSITSRESEVPLTHNVSS